MTPFVDPSLSPIERFALILDILRMRLGIGVRSGILTGVVMMVIWNRARRLFKRFSRLVADIEAGTVPPARVRAARVAKVAVAETEAPPTPRVLPKQRAGWVTHLVPECSWVGGTWEDLLHNRPEVAAYHAAAPAQMGRILRPMCRMFGVRLPAWLALPKRPRAARKREPWPPPDAHPEMWRWPHLTWRQRFGTKKQRDRDVRAWEAETGKKWS